MKTLFTYLLLSTIYLLLTTSTNASYVLPYPSYMPGNKIYRISRVVDHLKNYWYFGNIAQVKYHLSLSDKYLVEAKTLFEYNQYLLATDALVRSDKEFLQLPVHIKGAKEEGADVINLKNLIGESAKKHTEVLSNLLMIAPADFTWTPEKAKPTELNLQKSIQSSLDIRNSTAIQTSAY